MLKNQLNKSLIWFCAISAVIVLLLLFYIIINHCTDYIDSRFNSNLEKYIANHPDLFAKKEAIESETEIQKNPRDDIKWIGEKIKEYPENLGDLIANPKPEKINYKIGNIKEPDLSTEQIVQRNSAASVMVYTDASEYGYSYGTGFIIADNGIVATSYHLFGNVYDPSEIDGKRAAIILPDNKSFYPIVSVLYVDIEKDLIVVKFDGANKKFPTVKLGNSSLIKPGEKIITIGNSYGFINTVLEGLVSGFKKDETSNIIQFSNLVEGGNSGGAVFNSQGHVIGVARSGMAYTYGVNFAVPVNYLKDLISPK